MNNDWSYVEDSLQIRINAHKNFARHDIDKWILEKINLKGDEVLLDLCCGNGKQSIEYAKILASKGDVYAIDISEDLLKEAKEIAESQNLNINYSCRDINQKLPFEDVFFDIITCSFGIYYVSDFPEVVSEIFRLLKPGGKFLVIGPTINNAREMIEIYEEVTNKTIPQKREKRMDDEIIPEIKNKFGKVEVEIFNNPIEFPSIEEFIKYTCATLSFNENTEEVSKESVIKKFYDRASEKMTSDGKFILNKEVYGIMAYKQEL